MRPRPESIGRPKDYHMRPILPLVLAATVAGALPAHGAGQKSGADPIKAASAHLPKIRVAPDGRPFVAGDGAPFVPFGVTYYRPGTGWAPQVWKRFDADATRRDFARMKELGINCVRVFLSYGSFCPDPGVLETNGLAKF